MSSHPLNLALRFSLEITVLISAGIWGWKQGSGWMQYLLAFGIPVVLAVLWGVFNVPNDPSRSGEAPVVIPGIFRLTIELGIFVFATWCLYQSGYSKWSVAQGIIVALHYIISYDRIIWLISK